MFRQLVSLQIKLRPKDDKFLLQAFPVVAKEVVFPEMLLQGVVVEVVVRLPRVFAIAKEATLVFMPTVLVQFIIIVKALAAEPAEGMSLKSRLVKSSWLVVALPHMFLQLLIRE